MMKLLNKFPQKLTRTKTTSLSPETDETQLKQFHLKKLKKIIESGHIHFCNYIDNLISI